MSKQTAMYHSFKGHGIEVVNPTRILVVDRVNGPAHIFIDVVRRLFEPDVLVVEEDCSDDALYALSYSEYELIIVGLEDAQANHFALLHNLRAGQSLIPILVIGSNLSHADLESCHQFNVCEAVEMPRRAVELKSALFSVKQRYFPSV